jgi:hypothetical protein
VCRGPADVANGCCPGAEDSTWRPWGLTAATGVAVVAAALAAALVVAPGSVPAEAAAGGAAAFGGRGGAGGSAGGSGRAAPLAELLVEPQAPGGSHSVGGMACPDWRPLPGTLARKPPSPTTSKIGSPSSRADDAPAEAAQVAAAAAAWAAVAAAGNAAVEDWVVLGTPCRWASSRGGGLARDEAGCARCASAYLLRTHDKRRPRRPSSGEEG